MNSYLLAASLLTVVLGLIHSILGEIMLMSPMSDLEEFPAILKSRELAKRTIHVTWHLASILGWGFAAVLGLYSTEEPLSDDRRIVVLITALVMLIAGLATLIGSRGRHPGWAGFLAIAVLSWMGAA
jgi:hypothetical protein